MVSLLGHKINRCTNLKDCDKDNSLLMAIVEGQLNFTSILNFEFELELKKN